MPRKPGDDCHTGALIGLHHLPQLFGVEAGGERAGADEVAKPHRQLPAFSFRCSSLSLSGRMLHSRLVGLGSALRAAFRSSFAVAGLLFCRLPPRRGADEGGRTFPTEGEARGILKPTVRTAGGE